MSQTQRKTQDETSRRTAYGTPIKCHESAAERTVIFRLALLGTDRPGEIIRPAGLCQRNFRWRPFIHIGPEPLRGPIARNLWIGLCPKGLMVKNLYAPPEIEPLAWEILEAHLSDADVVQALQITIDETLEPGDPGFSGRAACLRGQAPAGAGAPARLITRWTLHDWAESLPADPFALQIKERPLQNKRIPRRNRGDQRVRPAAETWPWSRMKE